ncbi:MMPL family transporter [bacterium]|nr:MMPL family transporter [bacterium]
MSVTRFLEKLAYWHSNFPGRMLLLVLALTLFFGAMSEKLTVTMRWSDLLPENDKRTTEFNKIIDEFVTASTILVVVQGEDESRLKAFADELAPKLVNARDTTRNTEMAVKIKKLQAKQTRLENTGGSVEKRQALAAQIQICRERMDREVVQRVDFKSEVDFLRRHALMLLKSSDLKNLQEVYTDPNLPGLLTNFNNAMEKEYVGQTESISTRQKEDNAVVFLDGVAGLIHALQTSVNGMPGPDVVEQTVDKLLLGEPYLLSYDKQALLLNAIPNFSVTDIDLLVGGTEIVQQIVDEQLKQYPDLTAGLTGMIPVAHDEMVYSQQSLGYTSLIALIGIFILLIISFRMWLSPFLSIINLIVGIVWAMGITALVVGQLNMMTQMMAVILLGLGIDFSIHMISSFTENRAAGHTIAEAMRLTFLHSGRGIITGALTTACAFLTMMISSSRGMKEMGLVTGLGLLAILMVTFLLLPVMLVYKERFSLAWRNFKAKKVGKMVPTPLPPKDISFQWLGRTAQFMGRRWGWTLIIGGTITVLFLGLSSRITFDQNYMNIEPEGLLSVALQDTVLEKYDMSMDYAMVVANSIDESRDIAEQYRKMATVAMSDDISFYLPSPEQQQQRRLRIDAIRQEMGKTRVQNQLMRTDWWIIQRELKRLEMNIIEMQDMAFLGGQDKVDRKCQEIVGDPEAAEPESIIQDLLAVLKPLSNIPAGFQAFQRAFAPYFKKTVLVMCDTSMISMADLPEATLDRYSNRGRDQFLVTIFPAGNVWQDALFLDQFIHDLEQVNEKATGMPPVFKALIDVIGKDGRKAIGLTLIIVFLLLWLDFRKPSLALMAMVPLGIGLIWMVGFMFLTGQQFTVMNVMALPMILGIGIDDGVHIVHRWRSEGSTDLRMIFASTGKAILLTSLTTMLGFGSLIFSIWRGFGQLGAAFFVGVAACFITTVVFLAALLGRRG